MSPQKLLIELTDGQMTKPLQMVRVDTMSLKELLKKEGKNKFRKTFRYCYFRNTTAMSGDDYQLVESDELLRAVLEKLLLDQQDPRHQHNTGGVAPCFFLSNKPRKSSSAPITPPLQKPETEERQQQQQRRAVSFVIGNEADTEENAVSQLNNAASLCGCIFAIGMPDLHAGKGIPIGSCVFTEASTAYPQLVDNDIGCGMSFIELTNISANSFASNRKKLQRLADRLQSIDCPFADTATVKELCSKPLQWGDKSIDALSELKDCEHYRHLGTIGGGNHFAELQAFDELFVDASVLKEEFGIDTSRLHMLVHSGSRSLGAQYLREFCEKASSETAMSLSKTKKNTDANARTGHYAADTDSPLFQEYLSNHDTALNFAVRNRRLIAQRLLNQISSAGSMIESDGDAEQQQEEADDNLRCVIDIHHNFMERIDLPVEELELLRQMEQKQGLFPKEIPSKAKSEDVDSSSSTSFIAGWLHRKGATPTTSPKGLLVIPGSRGSLSYLVQVNPSLQYGVCYSLAHGAGRRMTRSKARALHQTQYPVARQLLQTELGGVVVCEKKDLVYEEAPASYKDIDHVVECLAEGIRGAACGAGLVRILATLRPVLTYKYKDPYTKSP